MRISDWSSDVCSSDLGKARVAQTLGCRVAQKYPQCSGNGFHRDPTPSPRILNEVRVDIAWLQTLQIAARPLAPLEALPCSVFPLADRGWAEPSLIAHPCHITAKLPLKWESHGWLTLPAQKPHTSHGN